LSLIAGVVCTIRTSQVARSATALKGIAVMLPATVWISSDRGEAGSRTTPTGLAEVAPQPSAARRPDRLAVAALGGWLIHDRAAEVTSGTAAPR
jgi:hypothetical protein